MASNDNSTPSNPERGLSSADKEKLIKELKERLKEIERLKRELGMAVSSENEETPSGKKSSPSPVHEEEHPAEDDSSHPVSTGRVVEEVEELKVPALEMLDDKPLAKKKKAVNTP